MWGFFILGNASLALQIVIGANSGPFKIIRVIVLSDEPYLFPAQQFEQLVIFIKILSSNLMFNQHFFLY